MKVGIVGGGAAGFFAAINVKDNYPDAEVYILEKTNKILSKVKVSGGGRCNVTNGESKISELLKAYPRGSKQLKKLFPSFNTKHAFQWFEDRGVALVTQDDNCVFPVSQDSQSIIDCLVKESRKRGVKVLLNHGVASLKPAKEDRIRLSFIDDSIHNATFDKVIVTTGGSPKRKGLEWLENLGHEIEAPVPSLFTLKIAKDSVTELMGVVIEEARMSLQGAKIESEGALLITHWGFSGPAALKLSSYGARWMADQNYQFKVQVNWLGEKNNEKVREELLKISRENAKKQLSNFRPYNMTSRLWMHILKKCGFREDRLWGEVKKKGLNVLINTLTNDIYTVNGKTSFKEEFVTCGGVSFNSVNPKTLESKVLNNLYFAGEVLDIDAITGGYNFQAAWTTGFIAAKLL